MRIRLHSSPSGIALIIVMVVIVVLGILAGGFAYTMKVETKLARNASYDSEAEWLARSGFELARYVLSEESKGPAAGYDGLNQKWAGGPGDTNGPLADLNLDAYEISPGSGQTISVKIEDQERKYNINTANEIVLRQALTLIGVDASLIPTIADSILDWRDQDNNTHLAGTESEYYQGLPTPYHAKDGPIDDLSELLMVKGIRENQNIYFGAGGAGRGTAYFGRTQGARRSAFDEEPIYQIGLVDLFTPLSGRLLNVNTASASALRVMPEIDDNIAGAIITSRAGLDGADGTYDDLPFRNVQEMARVPGLNPAVIPQLGAYFSFRSLIFKVIVTVQTGTGPRRYIGMIRRDAGKAVLLYMYQELSREPSSH